MVVPSRTQQRIERTRDRVTAAAWELLEDRPWSELTVADICELADVVPRTFHRYFPDKVELLFADTAHHEQAVEAAADAHELDPNRPQDYVLAVFVDLAGAVEGYGHEPMRRRLEVIASDPSLTARDLLKRARLEVRLAAALTSRTGDPVAARVWAAVLVATFFAGVREWAAGQGRPLAEHLEAALDAVGRLRLGD